MIEWIINVDMNGCGNEEWTGGPMMVAGGKMEGGMRVEEEEEVTEFRDEISDTSLERTLGSLERVALWKVVRASSLERHSFCVGSARADMYPLGR